MGKKTARVCKENEQKKTLTHGPAYIVIQSNDLMNSRGSDECIKLHTGCNQICFISNGVFFYKSYRSIEIVVHDCNHYKYEIK